MRQQNVVLVVVAMMLAVFQVCYADILKMIPREVPAPSVYATTNTITTEIGAFDTAAGEKFTNIVQTVLKFPPNDIPPGAISTSVDITGINNGNLTYAIPPGGKIAPESIALFSVDTDRVSYDNERTIFKASGKAGGSSSTLLLGKGVTSWRTDGAWITEEKLAEASSSLSYTPSLVGSGSFANLFNRVTVNCVGVRLKLDLTKVKPLNTGAILRVYVVATKKSDGLPYAVGQADTTDWGKTPILSVPITSPGAYEGLQYTFFEIYRPPQE